MQDESPAKKNTTANVYLMESEDEAIRLDIKTDPDALRRQALWCGVRPGMRILDCCCGSGKTTSLIYDMIQPGGSIVGIDFSGQRIAYAREHYGGRDRIQFSLQNLCEPMDALGEFDLIWVRFVLEYFRKESSDIVRNLRDCLKPGGTLCLIDLDYNCLTHYDMHAPLAATLSAIMASLDQHHNFDTYIGRKLYSFLYDNGFQKIEVELMAHNLLYGHIQEKDKYNWTKKIEIAAQKSRSLLESYPGGMKQFAVDFETYIDDPRRFSYTPLLLCKGIRPA
ncbi:MAG: class I SAM-dependent methyltransferase [Deltaproteobacteria bacterium]